MLFNRQIQNKKIEQQKSPWQEYKEKLGTTRPWDLLRPEAPRTSTEEESHRRSICEECPRFLKATKQCLECGCFINLKIKLKDSTCPLKKW